ncbi:MAG: hypothetical protein FI717_01170 [SAR202 cluster bacterium]|nr:hypothetical protein [SAR202 cluster bacterium]|tara:strand:+ start:5798 stop:6355 length:558 start_codon:yes stop_codon:yes gene_type:complete
MIADAWNEELPENHRIALDIAYSDFLDGYFHLSPTEADKIERVSGVLPEQYVSRYTSLFCRRFIICMCSVADRLAQPERVTPVPRCTAEALALHVLIEQGTALLREVKREEADYRGFVSQAFRDTDFLQLYEAGNREEHLGPNHRPRPNNIDFNDWFKPFDRNAPVNPFVYEDWTTEQSGLNFFR